MEQTELLKRMDELEREIKSKIKSIFITVSMKTASDGKPMSILTRWMNYVRRSKSVRHWKKR